ncbi:MAG: hypothetical protein DRO65_01210 [Candidatus Altiarchaeales archaeon]|nr:MAG: hypothetical protein DRO65_01210 [Candidatus Altiarchaeales archaeon]
MEERKIKPIKIQKIILRINNDLTIFNININNNDKNILSPFHLLENEFAPLFGFLGIRLR